MNLAKLSISRPIFITCIVLVMLALGFLSLKRLPVDLFPNITFPIVTVTTTYPGAGPKEIEKLVSKVLEDEFNNVQGIKRLRSVSMESLSMVICEFTLETDIKFAQGQIRDRLINAKNKLPKDVLEPVVDRMDPSNQPIMIITLKNNILNPAQLYDLANEIIRPKIEQIPNVGKTVVLGGRKREIKVELDRDLLHKFEISATQVSNRLSSSGQNIPMGKFTSKDSEIMYRTLGEFKSLNDISSTVVSFLGNEKPITLADVGKVVDSLQEEKSRTYINGVGALQLRVFKQSGANTIDVANRVKEKVAILNKIFSQESHKSELEVVWDNSKMIRANVEDVKESILIGIALTVFVVLFFLGNVRSTIITGLALPNSLLGAFVLMYAFGFTINVMTLLALSLAVGLLVDDAIVVRENIFRYLEKGKNAIDAAILGTNEVALAVIATSFAVISVFMPISFLQGMIGQFFKEFGLTICFAMLVSLFDALTIAPMMSAYFANDPHKKPGIFYKYTLGFLLLGFEKFQQFLEKIYAAILKVTLKLPVLFIIMGIAIFIYSIYLSKDVPKTFLSEQDFGEFSVSIELTPEVSLNATDTMVKRVDEEIRKNPEVFRTLTTVGGRNGEVNKAEIFVELVHFKKRSLKTGQVKDLIRKQLLPFSHVNPLVKDVDMVGGGMRPFIVNISGEDLEQLEVYAKKLFEKIKDHPALKDPTIDYQPGKPQMEVNIDRKKAEKLGVATSMVGGELRTLIEGSTPAVFRENSLEYDIRVRLKEDQRDLEKSYPKIYIPNINFTLIKLSQISTLVFEKILTSINRQDKLRYIQINADMAPKGPGMQQAMIDIEHILKNDLKLPESMKFAFIGQAENFKEMNESMVTAMILALFFIFMVLASLYESFITPFTIMLVLPLAISGAIFGLYLTHSSLDLYSMIGCILLLGLASKNSILLVDYANQQLAAGKERSLAIYEAGIVRLRPILMTTVALIAGMAPIAIGLNEASKQRTSMGVAVIGGLISSTLLSLIIVPAAFSYIDRFRCWSVNLLKKIVH